MDFSTFFPIWTKLNKEEQQTLSSSCTLKSVPAGTKLLVNNADCYGLILLCSGQMRAYILSEEGREITIYRLFERDLCLFSASCMMQNIQFEIQLEAIQDTTYFLIPASEYKKLMEHSIVISTYTNQIMASRFSEVMWLMEQILWKSIDKRLSTFLLEEMNLEGSSLLTTTHEKIASHLGSAREVITRMLHYFQTEGIVSLKRGTIEILDSQKLMVLSQS